MDMHATIRDYENDTDSDVTLAQARQFVSEHAADIETVERSTGWTGPHLRFPEKFTVTVRVAFPMHTLLVSFEGQGVNVERGARRIGNTNFDNWPLKYEVESEQADAFYNDARVYLNGIAADVWAQETGPAPWRSGAPAEMPTSPRMKAAMAAVEARNVKD